MMEPLLQVSHLDIQVGSQSLVRDVSFEVFPGKCTAIVGESGSGKTLSCLTLLQLNPDYFHYPTGQLSWHASLFSSPLNTAPVDERITSLRGRKIGMIFQEPMSALNPTMRVGEQVAEGIRYHLKFSKAEAKEKVLTLFKEVKIPDPNKAYDKYPHEMSGGQRQRVMIAMAISCEPQILIADEPTTALDVSVQKAVLLLLREIQVQRKMGLIFISHDLSVVREIADHICVMQRGEIVEQGDAKAVLDHPQHPYTQGLLACRPQGKRKGERLTTLSDHAVNTHPVQPLPSMEVILKVNQLTKRYDRFTAVDSASFEIRKGETLGLIGESGCGKTTLSRMLMGLLPITSGSVEWKGAAFMDAQTGFPKSKRKYVQMVFQDPFSSLNPKLKVGDLLMEPMEIHGIGKNAAERRQRAMEWLKKVGMPDPEGSMEKYPHSFSGGQRQRIVIARALASEPELLICDESVAALDVSVQAQVLNLLNDLKAELGLTFLFISHDLHVVRYMSDRVMVMQKGKLVEQGDTESVFTHPQNEYTKTLFDAAI